MAASSLLFGFRVAGVRMECIGAPPLLTRAAASLVENFRKAWDVRFVIFVAARVDFLERRTAIALLRRARFARSFLFTR